MRRPFLVTCGPAALVVGATVVACAGSEREDLGAPPLDAAGARESTDSGFVQTDADDEKDVEKPLCSPAGWCVTALPDPDLEMKHMWTLPRRAFALAESNP